MLSKTSTVLNMQEKIFSSTVANNFGTYMDDGVRRIDFVLVHNVATDDGGEVPKDGSDNEEVRRKFYEANLVKEGLELEYDQRTINDEAVVFVKVHVPWMKLCKYAEELKIKAPMWIQDELTDDKTDKGKFKFFSLSNENDNTVIMRKGFDRKQVYLFAINDRNRFFTDIQRNEITEEILQSVPCDPHNLKVRGIEKLVEDNVYESAYPLHDCEIDAKDKNIPLGGKRQRLHESWANWKMVFKHQPLTEVRNYYGEQIAFYFAWMDVYARMLVFPTIAGMGTFIYGLISTAYSPEYNEVCHKEGNDEPFEPFNVIPLWMCPICKPPSCDAWEMLPEGCFQYSWNYRLDNEWSIILSAFTSLWGIIFLKVWKRREATLAAEWDTEDAEQHDNLIRPEYAEVAKKEKRNPITFELEPFIPRKKIQMWFLGSVIGTVGFLLFTCACLAGLVISRIQLYGAFKPAFGENSVTVSRWLTHILLLIMIMILEIVFNKVAERLTNLETPRTRRQWMRSFLWKIFIFQFINDFVPIGYTAWIKGKTIDTPLDLGVADELCDGGCMGEVTEVVAVLLLIRLVLANMVELGLPMLQTAWRKFRSKRKVDDNTEIPQYVKDFHLNEIELDGVSEDLMQMMIQFAFNVLFIPALPVAPLVCFINTLIQVRLDAIKYLQTRRRVVPVRTSGIKIWNQFLDVTSKLGVVVNAAMLAFTSDNVAKLFYKLVYNPGNGIHGFTRFSLDSVKTEYFPLDENENEMLKNNITECWYPGFRQSEPPYHSETLYWRILTYQLAAFAAFIIVLFTIMWLINTFISDVPQSVKDKINRRKFLVAKAVEKTHAKKLLSKRNHNGQDENYFENKNNSDDLHSETAF